MADMDENIRNSTDSVPIDDTKTRKTVRLRPSVAAPVIPLPGQAPADAAIADPMANRDTDTGNLEILDDTKTRRTVKLKPLVTAPPRPSPVKLTPVQPEGAAPAASDGHSTATRKQVVLRSSTPAADGQNTATRKQVVLRGAASSPATPAPTATPPVTPAPAAEEDDTRTRKQVTLRPVRPAAPATPATPAAPEAKPVAAEPAAVPEGEDDQTVKLVRPKPAPKPAAAGNGPAKATPPQLKVPPAGKPAVPPAAKPAAPSAPAAPAAPTAPTAAPTAAPTPAPAAAAAAEDKKAAAKVAAPAVEYYESTAGLDSKFCMVVQVLSLLVSIAAVLFLAAQYFDVACPF